MGSETCNSRKHSFDISKSKRTRRTTLYQATMAEAEIITATPKNENNQFQIVNVDVDDEDEKQTNEHVKLKQFINVDDRTVDNGGLCDEKDESRPMLGQYFADEKQMQLVVKQPDEGAQGVKLKRAFKRYVKALGQMVKSSKRNHRLEKPVIRLPM